MAKIADLVVNLTLESAKFGSQIEASRKDIQRFTQEISSGFQTVRSVVTGALAAIGVSLSANFAKSLIDSAESLNKLSQKIGISVENLSTLEHSLKLNDVPMDTFTRGAGVLSKALAGLADEQEGGRGAAGALRALGIESRDAGGNLRPVLDVILDISAKFQSFADGVGKANLAMTLFGTKFGKELIPFLNQGPAAIRANMEEAKAFGDQISGDTARAAEAFNDSLVRVEDRAIGVSRQFLEGLAPALDVVAKAFDNATGSSDGFWKTLGSRTGLTVGGLILGIGRVGLEIERVNAKDIVDRARIDADIANLDRLFEELRKGAGLANNLPIDLALAVSHGAPKVQPPNLPNAADSATAKKLADELERVKKELESIASIKPSGPFVEASEAFRASIDKVQADLAKFPQLEITGIQRIGGLAVGVMNDYLVKIKAIGDEAQKEIDKILSKSLESGIQNVPTLPAKSLPTLSPRGQLENYIDGQLEAIRKQDEFNRKLDEFILRTGTAADGARVFFRQYAEYAKSAAQVFHDAFARSFGALEDQLTNLLANFKFDAAGLIRTVKEAFARATIQKFILGPIAEKFGLGERGSSRKNPIYAEVTNLPANLAGVFAPVPDNPDKESIKKPTDIFGKLQAEVGKIFSSIGTFLSNFLSNIMGWIRTAIGSIAGLFGGGFAEGGDLMPGKFYLVGERGPELFAPGRNFGAVIPNHMIAGNQRTSNVTQNFYLTPTKNDAFGYSESQLANATFSGFTRAMMRS